MQCAEARSSNMVPDLCLVLSAPRRNNSLKLALDTIRWIRAGSSCRRCEAMSLDTRALNELTKNDASQPPMYLAIEVASEPAPVGGPSMSQICRNTIDTVNKNDIDWFRGAGGMIKG